MNCTCYYSTLHCDSGGNRDAIDSHPHTTMDNTDTLGGQSTATRPLPCEPPRTGMNRRLCISHSLEPLCCETVRIKHAPIGEHQATREMVTKVRRSCIAQNCLCRVSLCPSPGTGISPRLCISHCLELLCNDIVPIKRALIGKWHKAKEVVSMIIKSNVAQSYHRLPEEM